MKKVSILMTALMLSAASYAQSTWTVDKAHAKLGFTVTHMLVSDVDGNFKNFDATITSAKPDFSDAVFNMTAQTASINTENESRDKHLTSPDFFDAATNPTVTFKSKSVKKEGANKFKLTGDLTMHGVTKTVVLDASFRGPAVNPMSKKNVAGFKITGKIKRADFKLATSTGNAMISEEIILNANGEFTQG
jgi:polyisoprenoid-binding protein YceI